MNPSADTLGAALSNGPTPMFDIPMPEGAVAAPTVPMSPNPDKAEALYTSAAPDGKPKSCATCWKFAGGAQCLEMPAEETVVENGWCAMHSAGTPLEMWPDNLPADRAARTKEELGYIVRNGGVSCGVCVHYEPQGTVVGYCHALSFRGLSPAPVDALGSSARFRGLPEPPEDAGVPPEGADDAEGR